MRKNALAGRGPAYLAVCLVLLALLVLSVLAAVWGAGVLAQAVWVLARYFVLRIKLARGRSADLRPIDITKI